MSEKKGVCVEKVIGGGEGVGSGCGCGGSKVKWLVLIPFRRKHILFEKTIERLTLCVCVCVLSLIHI